MPAPVYTPPTREECAAAVACICVRGKYDRNGKSKRMCMYNTFLFECGVVKMGVLFIVVGNVVNGDIVTVREFFMAAGLAFWSLVWREK